MRDRILAVGLLVAVVSACGGQHTSRNTDADEGGDGDADTDVDGDVDVDTDVDVDAAHPDGAPCIARPEECNGRDDDCDGEVDEDLECCGDVPCNSVGLPCGTCSGGEDGIFAPARDTALPGGTYRFESVTIPTGVTVAVTGGAPLQILSRGPVVIQGALDLSAGDGADGGCGMGEHVPGGRGGAGGFAGGTGGGDEEGRRPAQDGSGPGAGRAGRQGMVGGAGGGAGHGEAGADGELGTCCPDRCDAATSTTPGAAGGSAYDAALRGDPIGGSGGGGGGYGVADNGLGGGGGGGGGALLIVAPFVQVLGSIRANGGAGGDTGPSCDGGGGGGGSGGLIWLRGGTVDIDGSVEALGGRGGTTAIGDSCGLPGEGGAGAGGRIRVDAFEVAGTTTPAMTRGEPFCEGPPCDRVGPRCGDFSLTRVDWHWSLGDPTTNVYHITTLLRADGGEDCFVFPDYNEHTWLELSWDEGVSQAIYRPSDAFDRGAGFGPRECSATHCEIGDIFDTTDIYPGFPDYGRLQGLVDLYGPPDTACGYVTNVNMIEHFFCAELEPTGY